MNFENAVKYFLTPNGWESPIAVLERDAFGWPSLLAYDGLIHFWHEVGVWFRDDQSKHAKRTGLEHTFDSRISEYGYDDAWDVMYDPSPPDYVRYLPHVANLRADLRRDGIRA